MENNWLFGQLLAQYGASYFPRIPLNTEACEPAMLHAKAGPFLSSDRATLWRAQARAIPVGVEGSF